MTNNYVDINLLKTRSHIMGILPSSLMTCNITTVLSLPDTLAPSYQYTVQVG